MGQERGANQHKIILEQPGTSTTTGGAGLEQNDQGDDDQDKGRDYGDKRAAWTRSARQSKKEKTHRMKDQPEESAERP